MEINQTKHSRMFMDRRTKDRQESYPPESDRRSKHPSEFKDSPWWLQRNYLEENEESVET